MLYLIIIYLLFWCIRRSTSSRPTLGHGQRRENLEQNRGQEPPIVIQPENPVNPEPRNHLVEEFDNVSTNEPATRKRRWTEIGMLMDFVFFNLIPPAAYAGTMIFWQQRTETNDAHTRPYYIKQNVMRVFVVAVCVCNTVRVGFDYHRPPFSKVKSFIRKLTRLLTWATACVVAFNDHLLDYMFAANSADADKVDGNKKYYRLFLYGALIAQGIGLVVYLIMSLFVKRFEKSWESSKDAMEWKNSRGVKDTMKGY